MDEVVPNLMESIENEYIYEANGENSLALIKANRFHRKYPWAH